jgi:TolB-like protein
MRKKYRLRSILAVGGTLALAASLGCGYYSTTSRTAKDIKSIHVPFFSNETSEPNLEITVTETIIQNLIDDNTLKVLDEDGADALLEGRVVGFQNRPFSYNRELNAEEYHVSVRVTVSLVNRATDEAIWKDRAIEGNGSYFVEPVEGGNSFEEAVSEAIKEITERILNLTVQDW